MVSSIVKFKVADYAAWKKTFDSNSEFRRIAGSKGGKLYRGHEDPNQVTIIFSWEDEKKAREFNESPKLKELQVKSGIIGKPEMAILDEAESIKY